MNALAEPRRPLERPHLVFATAGARAQADELLPHGAVLESEVTALIGRCQRFSRYDRWGRALARGRWAHGDGWSARVERSCGRLDPGRRAWLVVEVVAG